MFWNISVTVNRKIPGTVRNNFSQQVLLKVYSIEVCLSSKKLVYVKSMKIMSEENSPITGCIFIDRLKRWPNCMQKSETGTLG